MFGSLQEGLDDLQVGLVVGARVDVDWIPHLDQGIEFLGLEDVFHPRSRAGFQRPHFHGEAVRLDRVRHAHGLEAGAADGAEPRPPMVLPCSAPAM
jgi:hypothetical protein